MMRLDKFLSECGMATRSEAKKQIKSGRITVNGSVVSKPESKVDEENDEISLDGKKIAYAVSETFVFYKPKGCVTARRDNLHTTVFDLLPDEIKAVRDLSPVGRLDLDTEGLLLLTNDGALNHRLMSPAHHVAKTYFARLDKAVPSDAVELFQKGIDIGDEKPTLPAELLILEDGKTARLTITEGRFHQVKRMFYAIGCEVVYLKREKLGTLSLDGLSTGECRRLTEEELQTLM